MTRRKAPLLHSATPATFVGPAYELSQNMLARDRMIAQFDRELLERYRAFCPIERLPTYRVRQPRGNSRDAARAAAAAAAKEEDE